MLKKAYLATISENIKMSFKLAYSLKSKWLVKNFPLKIKCSTLNTILIPVM